MERDEIIDNLQDLQRKVNKMSFKGQNEYDLHLREEIADWLLRQFAVRKSLPSDEYIIEWFIERYQQVVTKKGIDWQIIEDYTLGDMCDLLIEFNTHLKERGNVA